MPIFSVDEKKTVKMSINSTKSWFAVDSSYICLVQGLYLCQERTFCCLLHFL